MSEINIQPAGYTEKTKWLFTDDKGSAARKAALKGPSKNWSIKKIGDGIGKGFQHLLSLGNTPVENPDTSEKDEIKKPAASTAPEQKSEISPVETVIQQANDQPLLMPQGPKPVLTPAEFDKTVEFTALAEGSNTILQEFLTNMSGEPTMEGYEQSLYDLQKMNMNARVKHKMVPAADSKAFYGYIMPLYIIIREHSFNKLDKNKPESVELLRTKFHYHPGVNEEIVPHKEFEKDAIQMMRIGINNIESADNLEIFVKTHNDSTYYPYVFEKIDLEKKDFSAKWISIAAKRMATLSNRDIAVCLTGPKEDETAYDINQKNIYAAEIIKRLLLTPEDSNKLLAKFMPILELNNKFLHKLSEDDEDASVFHTNGIRTKRELQAQQKINDELIEAIAEEKIKKTVPTVVENSQQSPATTASPEESATAVEKNNSEDASGEVEIPVDKNPEEVYVEKRAAQVVETKFAAAEDVPPETKAAAIKQSVSFNGNTEFEPLSPEEEANLNQERGMIGVSDKVSSQD